MSDDYGDPNDIFFCNIEQILVINHKSLDAYDRRKKTLLDHDQSQCWGSQKRSVLFCY